MGFYGGNLALIYLLHGKVQDKSALCHQIVISQVDGVHKVNSSNARARKENNTLLACSQVLANIIRLSLIQSLAW